MQGHAAMHIIFYQSTFNYIFPCCSGNRPSLIYVLFPYHISVMLCMCFVIQYVFNMFIICNISFPGCNLKYYNCFPVKICHKLISGVHTKTGVTTLSPTTFVINGLALSTNKLLLERRLGVMSPTSQNNQRDPLGYH